MPVHVECLIFKTSVVTARTQWQQHFWVIDFSGMSSPDFGSAGGGTDAEYIIELDLPPPCFRRS
jgi:hypothetical protein